MDPTQPWKGQRLYSADLGSSRYDGEDEVPTDDPSDANLVSSIIADGSGLHRPVLDLDIPAVLIASSTPGHAHLYIDHPMPWEQYVRLLDALAEAGIVERGYVEASRRRGRTDVRLPWIRKKAAA
jgi:hypothetical protein